MNIFKQAHQIYLDDPKLALTDSDLIDFLADVLKSQTKVAAAMRARAEVTGRHARYRAALAEAAEQHDKISSMEKALNDWLDEPMLLSQLLADMEVRDFDYYTKFSPDNVYVMRGAFRSQDAIDRLGLDWSPQMFSRRVKLPGWNRPVVGSRFGKMGNWWTRRGSLPMGWAKANPPVDAEEDAFMGLV